MFDILMRAYDMVGYYYKQTKIYAGDILLQPKLDEINPYSNSDAEEAIASGREAARTGNSEDPGGPSGTGRYRVISGVVSSRAAAVRWRWHRARWPAFPFERWDAPKGLRVL